MNHTKKVSFLTHNVTCLLRITAKWASGGVAALNLTPPYKVYYFKTNARNMQHDSGMATTVVTPIIP